MFSLSAGQENGVGRMWELSKCQDSDPDLFFPKQGGSGHWLNPKAICDTCPIKQQCLAYALDNMSDNDNDPADRAIGRHGMWGGTTPDERKALHSRRMKVAA